jgi:adenylate cyclase
MVAASAQNKRLIPALKMAIVISIVVLALDFFGAFTRMEWIAYDERMKFFRLDKPLHKDIAVVLIDEASLQAMNPLVGRYPWPRSVYADLLDFFAMGGAKAVSFDIIFAENERTDANGNPSENDKRFISATEENGGAYHAVQVLRERADDTENHMLNRPLKDDFKQKHALRHATGFKDVGNNSFLYPIPGLYRAAKGVGIVEVEPDKDSVYRRVRLFSVYLDNILPAMSVTAQLSPDSEIELKDNIISIDNKHFIPVDDNGHYSINMVGKIEPYSVSGIFDSIHKLNRGDVENMLVYPDEFENKTIFVGASAIGLQDIKTTSLSSKTPGVFLHASVLSNFLEDDYLTPANSNITRLITLLMIFITLLGVMSTRKVFLQFLIPLVFSLLLASWSLWLFGQNYVLEIATPIVGIFVASLSSFAFLVRCLPVTFLLPCLIRSWIEGILI